MTYPKKLSVKIYGDSMLRKRAVEIAQVTGEHLTFSRAMFEQMRASHGVGLAAPQVGVSERLIVLDARCVQPQATPKALVNPRILRRSGSHKAIEGCLSLPGIEGEVRRAWSIRVRAVALGQGDVEFDAEGFEARIIQHEIDHLDGVLFIDRLPWWKRRTMRRMLARQLKHHAAPSAGGTVQTQEPVLL